MSEFNLDRWVYDVDVHNLASDTALRKGFHKGQQVMAEQMQADFDAKAKQSDRARVFEAVSLQMIRADRNQNWKCHIEPAIEIAEAIITARDKFASITKGEK